MGHGWTYSAHPLCAAAGVANLKLLDELGLVHNAGETGAHLRAAMADALGEHPHVGEVRGAGMLCAVELVESRAPRRFFETPGQVAGKVIAEMAARGVIARAMPEGDIIGFAPPLSLTREEAEKLADVTGQAVRAVLG
jgi:Adenosylmethionine-8-amino-7-oxononanoate aminotransferase